MLSVFDSLEYTANLDFFVVFFYVFLMLHVFIIRVACPIVIHPLMLVPPSYVSPTLLC